MEPAKWLALFYRIAGGCYAALFAFFSIGTVFIMFWHGPLERIIRDSELRYICSTLWASATMSGAMAVFCLWALWRSKRRIACVVTNGVALISSWILVTEWTLYCWTSKTLPDKTYQLALLVVSVWSCQVLLILWKFGFFGMCKRSGDGDLFRCPSSVGSGKTPRSG